MKKILCIFCIILLLKTLNYTLEIKESRTNLTGQTLIVDEFQVKKGTVTGNLDIAGSQFSAGGSTFVVKDGNVGIGTTSPGTKLDIRKPNQNLTSNVSGNDRVHLGLMTDDASNINKGGALGFGGRYITNSAVQILFGAIAGRKSLATSGSADGYLSFYVWNINGLKERMRITTGGNVGIKTTTPSMELDVNGDMIVRSSFTTTGDIYLSTNTAGVILRSPNQTLYRIKVDNAGVLTTESVP